jgi:hypothetical protein
MPIAFRRIVLDDNMSVADMANVLAEYYTAQRFAGSISGSYGEKEKYRMIYLELMARRTTEELKAMTRAMKAECGEEFLLAYDKTRL